MGDCDMPDDDKCNPDEEDCDKPDDDKDDMKDRRAADSEWPVEGCEKNSACFAKNIKKFDGWKQSDAANLMCDVDSGFCVCKDGFFNADEDAMNGCESDKPIDGEEEDGDNDGEVDGEEEDEKPTDEECEEICMEVCGDTDDDKCNPDEEDCHKPDDDKCDPKDENCD